MKEMELISCVHDFSFGDTQAIGFPIIAVLYVSTTTLHELKWIICSHASNEFGRFYYMCNVQSTLIGFNFFFFLYIIDCMTAAGVVQSMCDLIKKTTKCFSLQFSLFLSPSLVHMWLTHRWYRSRSKFDMRSFDILLYSKIISSINLFRKTRQRYSSQSEMFAMNYFVDRIDCFVYDFVYIWNHDRMRTFILFIFNWINLKKLFIFSFFQGVRVKNCNSSSFQFVYMSNIVVYEQQCRINSVS